MSGETSPNPTAPVVTPLSERLREAPATFTTFPRSGSALYGEAAEAIDRLYAMGEKAVDMLIEAETRDDWSAVHDVAAWIEEQLNREHDHA